MGAQLVFWIDAAGLLYHPAQMPDQIFLAKLAKEHHLHHVVVGARRLDILPALETPQQALVKFVQTKPVAQPLLVARQGILAIAQVAIACRNWTDAIPQTPDEQIGPLFVTLYYVAQ